MQETLDMEHTREKTAMVIGRFGDLGLGNPEGIPSYLAEASPEALQERAETDRERLVAPEDVSCTACIDGRFCMHNADGSAPKTRLRRVGGSASNFGVALNANAPIIATLDSEAPLRHQVELIDGTVGYRSAHLGGCGGANGEITDNRLIHENPAIMDAVKAFMTIPEVQEYLEIGYDEQMGQKIRENAGKTASFLEAKDWDGQAYVDGVAESNPENVEDLEVDHDDKIYHGHKEPVLLVIIGDMTAPLDYDGFVWNLKASKEAADKLADQGGQEGYQRAIIAEIAKHIAVGHRLASDNTPILLVSA